MNVSPKHQHSKRVTYFAIMVEFSLLFAGVAILRVALNLNFPNEPIWFWVLFPFAILRTSKLFAYDVVMEGIRSHFAQTAPDPTGAGDSTFPRTDRGPHLEAFGELLCCPICVGTHVSAFLTYGLLLVPPVAELAVAVLGGIGVAELLNSLMELLEWAAQVCRETAGALAHEREAEEQASEFVDLERKQRAAGDGSGDNHFDHGRFLN